MAYTHVALLLLSLPKRNLLITGKTESKLSSIIKNNPVRAIQSSRFIIDLCKREADTLAKVRYPFSTTLKRLDKYSKKKNAKGKEASLFAERLRSWIIKRHNEVLKYSYIYPVSSLEDLKDFTKLMKNLEQEEKLNEEIKKIENLSGLKNLVKIIKEIDKLESNLASKRSSKLAIKRALKKKQSIAEKLNSLIQDQDADEKVKAEAKILLSQFETMNGS